MGSQNQIGAEFLGSFLMTATAALVTLLKIDGVNFALSLCLSYAVLIFALKSLEETNLNPALTLADIFTKRLSTDQGFLIIFAQFAGATLGAVAVSWLSRDASGMPCASEGASLLSILASQLAFGSCLVYANMKGFSGSRSRPIWLAVYSYGAYLCGCCTASCLNPAVAFAADTSRAWNHIKVDGSFMMAFVFIPLLAAFLGVFLEKLNDNNLLMTELTGTFFLCLGMFCAVLGNSVMTAAIGVTLFSAAIVKAFAATTGGVINPAVSVGGIILGSDVENAMMTAFFQLGGGALAALVAQQALGLNIQSTVDTDMYKILIASAFAALLMASFGLTFNNALGTPATPLIGLSYGGSIACAFPSLAINPAATLGALLVALLTRGSINLQAFLGLLYPIGAAALCAFLLTVISSDYRRSI